MLGLLKEISRKFNLKIYAFCLMPNHIHLLFRQKEANLYDAMRDLFSRYAMWFNKKYERKGHLFGGPYRQAVCLDDTYLLAISIYIHLNPLKAGLISDSLNYRWSSCRLYCEEIERESFVSPYLVLGLISEDLKESKEKYRTFLKRGGDLSIGQVLEFEDAVERFRLKLASVFPSVFKHVGKENKVEKYSGIKLVSQEKLEGQINKIKNNDFPDKPSSRKAKKFLVEQLISRGYKRSEIGEKLGVSIKTVYNILKST